MAQISDARGCFTIQGTWTPAMIDNLNILVDKMRNFEYNTLIDGNFSHDEISQGFQANGRNSYHDTLVNMHEWFENADRKTQAAFKKLCKLMTNTRSYIEIEFMDSEPGQKLLYEEIGRLCCRNNQPFWRVYNHTLHEYSESAVENLIEKYTG